MSKLIDAENLYTEVASRYDEIVELEGVLEIIERAPTVDAVPVVHGKWSVGGIGWLCSHCGYSVMDWNNTPYCPRCGAKMDLK